MPIAKPSLPKYWPRFVQSSLIHVFSLAQYAMSYTRGWAVYCKNPRVRSKAELNQAHQEIALLREQIRILNARMEVIPPSSRPNYPPPERLAILELKAVREWSLDKTAKAFLVTPATIASWMKRLDEEGPKALIQVSMPVNKFPDFVRYVVQRLKTLCPALGKAKIAQTLARAGLHLGATTVSNLLKQKPSHEPFASVSKPAEKTRIVTAKYPNHVWHVDLTVVPTGGFWTTWMPFALPQQWPFAYWLAVVIDHYSRRVMGVTAFKSQPTCAAVCGCLGRAIARAGKSPKYIV
jgi:hypothetical protein